MFICISKFLRLLVAFVSNIKPHTTDNKEIVIKKALTISVGNRGTNPEYKYSIKIGINKINEKRHNKTANMPKKLIGL